MSNEKLLIVYGTQYGQTARIVSRIAEIARCRGHVVNAVHARDLPATFAAVDVDAVIVGASVYAGKHQNEVRDYVRRNRAFLQGTPSAFFSVSLAAARPAPEDREEAQSYLWSFIQETGWKPRHHAIFKGALNYTQYNFLTRMLMKLIQRSAGGDTDTSRDYEYTDWEHVEQFADEFLDDLERVKPPTPEDRRGPPRPQA